MEHIQRKQMIYQMEAHSVIWQRRMYNSCTSIRTEALCTFTPNVREVGTWHYALIPRTSTFTSTALFIIFTLACVSKFSLLAHN
jgi:hypothetical protein